MLSSWASSRGLALDCAIPTDASNSTTQIRTRVRDIFPLLLCESKHAVFGPVLVHYRYLVGLVDGCGVQSVGLGYVEAADHHAAGSVHQIGRRYSRLGIVRNRDRRVGSALGRMVDVDVVGLIKPIVAVVVVTFAAFIVTAAFLCRGWCRCIGAGGGVAAEHVDSRYNRAIGRDHQVYGCYARKCSAGNSHFRCSAALV